MSYLLDTNVCIQYLACPGSLVTARMASMSRELYFSNTMSGSLVVFLIYKLKTGKFKDGDRGCRNTQTQKKDRGEEERSGFHGGFPSKRSGVF